MAPFRQSPTGCLINHLARLFGGALQDGIRPLGLSTDVFPITVHLWDQDGPPQKQLVDRVGVEQATMANTLAKMERNGLIVRQQNSSDRRVQHTWLTEHGQSLRDPALTVAEAKNASVLADLSTDKCPQIVDLL